MELQQIIKEMRRLDVTAKTDTKNKLTYLSWAYAWDETLKIAPAAEYEVVKQADGKPYLYDPSLGYMVETRVTIEGKTHQMWLPVMDGANKAMRAEPYEYEVKDFRNGGTKTKKCEAATMFDINKTIMRCLTKNLAMFGLGLYIYAGEDLPEAPKEALSESGLLKAVEWVKEGKTTLFGIQKKYDLKADQIKLIENAKA